MTVGFGRACRATLLAAALLLQSACTGQLLTSNQPSPETYRLGASSTTTMDATAASPVAPALALAVARPRASPALDTERIAVIPAASRFDYYADVRWAEAAPQMLQQGLVAALQASGRFAGVFAAPARVPTELLLDVELRHFEAVASGEGAAPAVHVQLQVSVVDTRRAERVTSFLGDARVVATQNRRSAIIAAFDRATAQVVAETVARVGEAVSALPATPAQPIPAQ